MKIITIFLCLTSLHLYAAEFSKEQKSELDKKDLITHAIIFQEWPPAKREAFYNDIKSKSAAEVKLKYPEVSKSDIDNFETILLLKDN